MVVMGICPHREQSKIVLRHHRNISVVLRVEHRVCTANSSVKAGVSEAGGAFNVGAAAKLG